MDFTQELILENERVLLRPLTIEDVELLLPFSEKEPELSKFSLSSSAGRENLIKYISDAIDQRQQLKSYPFIVFDKLTNQIAGTTRFYDYQAIHKTTQLGYTWYGKKFQGTGLNKNCKFLMLNYAFEVLELERVEFRADYNNKKSIAAMKSIGCVEEGILRSNCASKVGRRDSIILSILKDEWNNELKERLELRINSL